MLLAETVRFLARWQRPFAGVIADGIRVRRQWREPRATAVLDSLYAGYTDANRKG